LSSFQIAGGDTWVSFLFLLSFQNVGMNVEQKFGWLK